ncbi:hypothetical protein [Streptomyces sp. NPDC059649]|uniref:hypothetical protein n=1 Tax=Streptomyces sp. NPDC059649 TaxID=3346895 RepID=UPI0036D12F10
MNVGKRLVRYSPGARAEGFAPKPSIPLRGFGQMLLWAIIVIGVLDIVVVVVGHLFDVIPGLMEKATRAYKSAHSCWRTIKGEKKCDCGSGKDNGKGTDPGP